MTQVLQHHGVLGMKWGIRRYQPYPNGSKVKGGKEIGAATKVKQRTDKLENYKSKKISRNQKKLDITKTLLEFEKENLKDLKKKRTNSDMYKQYVEKKNYQRTIEYDERHKEDKGKPSYGASGEKIVNDIIDLIGAQTKVDELIKDSSEKIDSYKAKIDKLIKTDERLQNINIDLNTRKRDIRRASRSGF